MASLSKTRQWPWGVVQTEALSFCRLLLSFALQLLTFRTTRQIQTQALPKCPTRPVINSPSPNAQPRLNTQPNVGWLRDPGCHRQLKTPAKTEPTDGNNHGGTRTGGTRTCNCEHAVERRSNTSSGTDRNVKPPNPWITGP